jgi:hypothetical protein
MNNFAHVGTSWRQMTNYLVMSAQRASKQIEQLKNMLFRSLDIE